MKLILLINTLLLLNITVLPQQILECGTRVPIGIRPEQVTSNNLEFYGNNTTYTLRLAIHIIKFQDGSGGITEENLQDKLDALNELMAQADFQFYEYKRVYILSDYFANLDQTKLNELFSTYYIDGCINVYFVPIFLQYGWGTFSSRFGNTPQGIAVFNDAHQTTLAHEMGHYFDLLHTHHIWEVEEIPGVTVTIIENIDRAGPCKNCSSAGDLLCDTPADPSIRFSGNLVDEYCNWNTNNSYPPDDCNRTDYNPLTDNLMTTELYYHCRTALTSQQKQRMKETLLQYRNKLLKHLVYLENSNESSNLGGSLHINSDDYLSGENGFVETGQHNVGTNNERFSNSTYYKHKYWNENQQDYLLSRAISIENDDEQIAKFSELKQVVIRNIIDGISFNDSLPVWFSEPWYVKNQYNNQLGMGNYITPPPKSPYSPTGKYNESSGGVFLNQGWPNWDPPYYSVKADYVQDITLQQTGRTHTFYFQHWSATPQGSATFQNANALETAIVFNQENATVQANLKGTQLSNNPNAYNYNNQRKYARADDGYLHLVYESMGSVWYEISPDNGATWYIQNNGKPISFVGKQPSLDFDKTASELGERNQIVIVWQEKSGTNSVIKMAYFDRLYETPPDIMNWRDTKQMGYVWGAYETTNCTPVVGLSYNTYRVVYKNGSSGALLCRYDLINPNTGVIGVYGNPTTLTGTNNYSVNPSIAANKTSGTTVLVWEQIQNDEYSSIKYDRFISGAQLSGNITTISANSGSPLNFSPSVSFANNAPVVSWTGGRNPGDGIDKRKVITTRGTTWGSFQIVGTDVNFVNNNSAAGTSEKTVISWSEGTVNPVTKWIKRDGTSYSTPHLLSNSGIQSQISSGTNFQTMSAMVFNNLSTPYYFQKSTTDFSVNYDDGNQTSLNKITENDTIVTFGRSGVASINEVEFVFEIGDILVSDSVIRFMEIPDTLVYNSSDELNQHTRTDNFTLTPNTNFYFSNIYYVVQKSNPDSALTASDAVNFRVELINAATNQVVGTFDNITYDKNNLEKYASIDYSVDCSGITAGEYYLRLVTNVTGNASYSLANIFNDNTTFAKKNYN
ncbi:MAG: hypothetical protein HRF52_10130, partial [Ignavibacterium sp.]